MEVRRTGERTWAAAEGGRELGHATVWLRPDRRTFLHLAPGSTKRARLALLRAVPPEVEGELHTWVRAGAGRLRDALAAQGFVALRREDHLEIDPARADRWLRAHPGPALTLVGVHDVGLDRLRRLDEELRQDVPGCDGWRWDPAAFRAETLGAAHDDALYRVALEDGGELVGLVRVWVDRDAPRIGLVGVRRVHRGRGVARSLLAEVMAVLVARGETTVVTEADPDNTPIRRLLDAMGATVTATLVEHVRPATVS